MAVAIRGPATFSPVRIHRCTASTSSVSGRVHEVLVTTQTRGRPPAAVSAVTFTPVSGRVVFVVFTVFGRERS